MSSATELGATRGLTLYGWTWRCSVGSAATLLLLRLALIPNYCGLDLLVGLFSLLFGLAAFAVAAWTVHLLLTVTIMADIYRHREKWRLLIHVYYEQHSF